MGTGLQAGKGRKREITENVLATKALSAHRSVSQPSLAYCPPLVTRESHVTVTGHKQLARASSAQTGHMLQDTLLLYP